MPNLAWLPRGLPLASWAHVGRGPIRALGLALPAAPPPTPRPAASAGGGVGFCTSAPGTQSQASRGGAVGRLLGADGAASVSEVPVCPASREVQLQAALLRHYQPAGQHLRQQGPLHQRVPLAAGRPPAAPVQLQPRAVRPAGAPRVRGRRGPDSGQLSWHGPQARQR